MNPEYLQDLSKRLMCYATLIDESPLPEVLNGVAQALTSEGFRLQLALKDD